MVKAWRSCSILTILALVFSLAMVTALWGLVEPVNAADFHVTTAAEFQTALDAAEVNQEDDTIWLAAGIYQGNFVYEPPETEHKSLTITGEPGTSAADIILDGQNNGRVLALWDWTVDWSTSPPAEITINGITIENGNCPFMGGGILASLGRYNISISNCVIKNNITMGGGGGIYMVTNESLILEDNLILENTATEGAHGLSIGGGVYMSAIGGCTIRNNVIAGNIAQGITDPWGGGLFVGWWNPDDVIHLIGNTIYGNEANKGGGVYFCTANIANVYNNIIYGNTATSGGDIYLEAVANGISYNNDYSNMWGTWTDFGSNIDANPDFADTANDDYHLTAGSPCIDTGTISVPNPPGLPATDIEDNPRIWGVAPDMGAYEWVGSMVVWNCPIPYTALISPYPNQGRPSLPGAADLSQVTRSTPGAWFQVYYMDAQGNVTFYDSVMSGGTLDRLESREYYWVVVSVPCNLYIPQ